MIEKWLHVNELGGDPWVRPIWAAANDAAKAKNMVPLPQEIKELGGHISIRLNILPRVIERINKEVKEVFLKACSHKPVHEFSEGNEGFALPLDNDLKYNLITDIDSLLFELNSVCELMEKLFDLLYSHAGQGQHTKKGTAGLKIKSVIENSEQDPGWFRALDDHRNFFIHEGAPYFVIDITGGPENYDMLIMKENIKEFKDESKYIKLSELNEMVQGFEAAIPAIQENLIDLFK